MTVARILALKGREVITAQPHRTMREIADILARHKIGAVVISGADGEVLGILSERDIVRAISTAGADALQEQVSRHMTSKVITTTEDASIEETMGMMTDGRFRHIPVVRDDRLIGVVSIGDVVKIRLEAIETEHRALREYIATA